MDRLFGRYTSNLETLVKICSGCGLEHEWRSRVTNGQHAPCCPRCGDYDCTSVFRSKRDLLEEALSLDGAEGMWQEKHDTGYYTTYPEQEIEDTIDLVYWLVHELAKHDPETAEIVGEITKDLPRRKDHDTD